MTVLSSNSAVDALKSTTRANALADRLEEGARALAELALSLSDKQWATRFPNRGQCLPVGSGVSPESGPWGDGHRLDDSGHRCAECRARNSSAAAVTIRALSDEGHRVRAYVKI